MNSEETKKLRRAEELIHGVSAHITDWGKVEIGTAQSRALIEARRLIEEVVGIAGVPTRDVVHALVSGFALCGFSPEVPKNWPRGHKWTGVDDLRNISCENCKAQAEKKK